MRAITLRVRGGFNEKIAHRGSTSYFILFSPQLNHQTHLNANISTYAHKKPRKYENAYYRLQQAAFLFAGNNSSMCGTRNFLRLMCSSYTRCY